MTTKLFLDGIFDDNNISPSSIIISMPNPSGKGITNPTLTGLMIGDPTWGASNKWGTVINDITNLTDISSLVGSESMFSWINASTMCWKGTDPLSMSVEFYLINYRRGQRPSLEENLRSFIKLASLYKDPDATAGKDFKVLVHGGYAADILSGNSKAFYTAGDVSHLKGKNLKAISDKLYGGKEDAQGSIQVQFGHKSTISNLLLAKVNVTESTIEVADQNGGNIKPLYYRVSAQFVGVKPLLTVDVDRMFVGGSSGAAGGFWGGSGGSSKLTNKIFAPSGY